MKLILINGQTGTGKSIIADTLRNQTPQSAFIDADSLVAVNPLGLHEERELIFTNAIALINNFVTAGYTIIFTAGLTKNQEYLDKFIELLNGRAEITFVWLRASKEIRMNRKLGRARDIADNAEHFDVIDTMYPDIEKFEIQDGVYKQIDTTSKTIQEVIEEIKSGM